MRGLWPEKRGSRLRPARPEWQDFSCCTAASRRTTQEFISRPGARYRAALPAAGLGAYFNARPVILKKMPKALSSGLKKLFANVGRIGKYQGN
jgi:hypothetical protein